VEEKGMTDSNINKRVWILTGNEENWNLAVSDKLWGVREGRLKGYWDSLKRGDILLFYATSPIGGLIGLGLVESKFKQDKPLWPDEVRENRVLYPYRFGFEVVYYLPQGWKERNINIADLNPPYMAGINSLSRADAISEIFRRIKEKWNVEVPSFGLGKKKKEETKERPSQHNEIRDKLYFIGQMENFISEKEYPIDGERLDVAWRKVAKGVPTRVFEVQMGGSVHQALAKLKHSWDLWNSEPFLIIDLRHKEKVDELLSGTFHEMAKDIRVITVDKVEELYRYLISGQGLREEFGL
jgi:predicted RNA-binding protein